MSIYKLVEDIPEDDCVVSSSSSLKGAKREMIQELLHGPTGPDLAIIKNRVLIGHFQSRDELLRHFGILATFACPHCGSTIPHQHFVDRKGNVPVP